MRIIPFFLAIISFFGCCPNTGNEPPPDKLSLISDVRKKVALKVRKERNLCAIGTGAQAMDQIKMLGLSFNYNEELTIDEGRELLVYVVDEFVRSVNEEPKIQPFLANVPFEAKNIEIRIFLQKPDGHEFEDGKLSVIRCLNGRLEFAVNDSQSDLLVKTAYTESFAQALEKTNNR